MDKKYWDTEEPTVVKTDRNVFRFYRDAQRLQVSTLSWINKNGVECPGKTVAIDINALRAEPDAVELFRSLTEG